MLSEDWRVSDAKLSAESACGRWLDLTVFQGSATLARAG